MGYFVQYKGRVFDHTNKMHPQKSDFDPLFSSFSKNGVFVPPPNSKEALRRQKLKEKKSIEKSKVSQSAKTSHRMSMIATNSRPPIDDLVDNDQNIFKRVQSSQGYRAKSTITKGDKRTITDYSSTKGSTQVRYKGKRCLSIRSGAFRS